MDWEDAEDYTVAGYRPAAVCRRGHVETFDLTREPAASRCPACGAQILTECPACGARIRGYHHTPGLVRLNPDNPPDFCDGCGSPFPWANRAARLWELENLLDEQGLSEADRLAVSEQLKALRELDLDEDEQKERWGRIKKLAPGLIQAGRSIIESVAASAIQKSLGW